MPVQFIDLEPGEKDQLIVAINSARRDHSLDRDLLDSSNRAALKYCLQGRYSEAIELYRLILNYKERIFGQNHPVLVPELDKLSVVLEIASHPVEARAVRYRTFTLKPRR